MASTIITRWGVIGAEHRSSDALPTAPSLRSPSLAARDRRSEREGEDDGDRLRDGEAKGNGQGEDGGLGNGAQSVDFSRIPPDVMRFLLGSLLSRDAVRNLALTCRGWRDATRDYRAALRLLRDGKRIKRRGLRQRGAPAPATRPGPDGAGPALLALREATPAAGAGTRTGAGELLGHGSGSGGDWEEPALACFLEAANKGLPGAMLDAGLLLWDMGRENEGVRWFREAVSMGHTTAKYNLGVALLWQAKNPNQLGAKHAPGGKSRAEMARAGAAEQNPDVIRGGRVGVSGGEATPQELAAEGMALLMQVATSRSSQAPRAQFSLGVALHHDPPSILTEAAAAAAIAFASQGARGPGAAAAAAAPAQPDEQTTAGSGAEAGPQAGPQVEAQAGVQAGVQAKVPTSTSSQEGTPRQVAGGRGGPEGGAPGAHQGGGGTAPRRAGGRGGRAARLAAAAQWYWLAAEGGSAKGMFNLAQCYKDGVGVPRDGRLSWQWLRRAAERRHRGAQLAVQERHGGRVRRRDEDVRGSDSDSRGSSFAF